MAVTDLKLSDPITLPCGLKFPNRLAKAAMAESWADDKSLPRKELFSAYETWADGDWGMLLTGNVQVDIRYLGSSDDHALNDDVPRDQLLSLWKGWAKAASKNGTPAIMQINHPGRQSPLGAGKKSFFTKNLAPSAVPLRLGNGFLPKILSGLLFGTPKEMTHEDIHYVVSRFADTAKLAAEAGFAGVEIHGAHGYLLSQFLSPDSNRRTDEYGGSPKKRARIVVEVLNAVRKVVPKDFAVGIKLNSADYRSKEQLAACIEQLEDITATSVDFVEISGGSYEDPSMMDGGASRETKKASTLAREAFFLEFAKTIRDRFRTTPLMVTGGFRTREGMEHALREDACDIIGLARPAVLNPFLPKNLLLNTEVKDADAKVFVRKAPELWLASFLGMRAISGGADTQWYAQQIRVIAK